jgi:hypothetical protein
MNRGFAVDREPWSNILGSKMGAKGIQQELMDTLGGDAYGWLKSTSGCRSSQAAISPAVAFHEPGSQA